MTPEKAAELITKFGCDRVFFGTDFLCGERIRILSLLIGTARRGCQGKGAVEEH